MISVFLKALSQIGVKEIVGKNHNPTIVQYAKDIGHLWVVTDETAWCSIFINWCCHKAGFERSRKLDARSWLNVGEKVDNPEMGDVVIFWRGSPNSWMGHVALFVRETPRWIYVLGGNQGNKVCIQAYPKKRLLGYRRLWKIS